MTCRKWLSSVIGVVCLASWLGITPTVKADLIHPGGHGGDHCLTVKFLAPVPPDTKPTGGGPGWGGLILTFSRPLSSAEVNVSPPSPCVHFMPVDGFDPGENVVKFAPGNYSIPQNHYVTVRVCSDEPVEFVSGFWRYKSSDTSTQNVFGITAIPVPEPSTLTLLGIGACGVFGYGWRRRRSR